MGRRATGAELGLSGRNRGRSYEGHSWYDGREGAEIRTPGKSEGSWEEATVKGTEVVRE